MSHNDDLRETLLTVPLLPIRIRPDPDPNSKLTWIRIHTIASAPAVTGSVFTQRFRLFLGGSVIEIFIKICLSET